MRRLKLLLMFACVYLGSTSTVFAAQLDGYFEASRQFDAWIEKTGAMPRLSDGRAAMFLATLSDSQRFLDGNTFDEAQLPALLDLCDKANRKGIVYLMFDLDKEFDESMPLEAAQQVIIKRMLQNAHTYQDELAELQPFATRCMGRLVSSISPLFDRMKPEEITSVRRAGLDKMRKGMDSAVLGTLVSASDLSLKDRYRTNTLMAVAETAPQFVSAMNPDEREKLLSAAKEAISTAPENLKGYIEKIADALAEPSCEGLCRY